MSQVYSTESIFIHNVLNSFINGQKYTDIPCEIDITKLEELLIRNHLIPIFHFMLSASKISESQLNKWEVISINVLFNYYKALKSTTKLFRVLEAERIPAVVLRGMSLAEWIYPEPSLRPMNDVDILIQFDSHHTLVEKLKKHGILPHKILRSQFVYSIENTIFEIHWSFLTPKRYRKASDFNEWLISRRSVTTSEGPIYCLKPEDELLELVLHGFIHHELDTILKIIDIALLVKYTTIDWDYILTWCKNASLTRLFCFTMAYVNYFFDLNLREQLDRFNVSLPLQNNKLFDAYISYSFNEDSLIHFMRRKKNMMFVAEQSKTKIKQFARFFNTKEIRIVSELVVNELEHRLRNDRKKKAVEYQ